MKKMLLFAGLLALSQSNLAQAATAFPNGLVPQALIDEFGSGGSYYSSLPDDFPLAELKPDVGLQLVGSIDRISRTDVLLYSPASVAELTSALAPLLLGDGWQLVENQGDASHRTAKLCHDTHGTLSLRLGEREHGGAKLALSLNRHGYGDNTPDCAELMRQSYTREALLMLMNSIFPRLSVPAGALTEDWDIGGLTLVLSDSLRFERNWRRTVVAPGHDAGTLYEHFAAQLGDRWTEDGSAIGTRSASGTWLREVVVPSIDCGFGEDVCTTLDALYSLSVLGHGDDTFELRASLVSGPPAPCRNSTLNGPDPGKPIYCAYGDTALPITSPPLLP